MPDDLLAVVLPIVFPLFTILGWLLLILGFSCTPVPESLLSLQAMSTADLAGVSLVFVYCCEWVGNPMGGLIRADFFPVLQFLTQASGLGGASLDFFVSEGDLSSSPPSFSLSLYFNAPFCLI
jgi:hypothetical protein